MLFTYFRFPYTTTETVRDVLCWCGVRSAFQPTASFADN